ncbi:MAG TPA: MFS transporter [Dokdonella sp.]|uniref:MFS transporter n=2 Tax=Dokdonella sp. TaxID=2291710 RepID=UPI002BDDF895|nr:MFS transporter [Dokdonella sp.]HPW03673.1 MFS transporter [Dokdonella sp.]
MPDFPQHRPAIPRSVWALGLVSLFTDIGSEMVHSLLPLLLVGSLGASGLVIGLIEGTAEALVLIVKVFSGYLSDAWGRRKPLVLLGYGLAALSKPLFPMAGSVTTIVAARLLDRFGKGIRGAPRDALIADVTPVAIRGSAFGLRQAMDTLGAVVGPLCAVALMTVLLGDIRAVLWFAVLPGLIAVALIVFAVREPESPARPARLPITREGLASLGKPYWMLVAVAALLALARFSEAFLILRGAQLGLADAHVPLVLVAMSVVYALSSWPSGSFSDRYGRRALFVVGVLVLVIADGVLALATGPVGVFAGAALWGLHLGMTQGVLSAMIVDASGAQRRGTAFGVYGLASGVGLLVASVVAGAVWDGWGGHSTFALGGVLAALTLAAAMLWMPRNRDMP